MVTALDHVIVACTDPDFAAAELESTLGLRAGGGGRHDAHGTYNRLIWLGDSYVELMGVFDPALAADSWWGAHISRLLGDAPAAYAGVAFATNDLAADVDRLRGMGSPISDPVAGQRARPDGDVVRWRIGRLPAPDPELGLMFLIEHDTSAAEWRPADRATRAAEQHPGGTAGRLVRLELPVTDVRSTTLRLVRELGLQFRPSLAGRGARDTSLGAQTLRLSPAAPVPTMTIRAGRQATNTVLLGCRWELLTVSDL